MPRSGAARRVKAPGWIGTGSQLPEEAIAGVHTPIGRSGTPEEVGEVIAFLASERASYVTGTLIVMIGLILIESAVEWVRVLSGRKQASVKESPFVATQFATEEQG